MWIPILFLVGGVAPARAEEEAEPPSAVEQAADAVEEAWGNENPQRIEQLAQAEEPDPRLVAATLIGRGRHDAASAWLQESARSAWRRGRGAVARELAGLRLTDAEVQGSRPEVASALVGVAEMTDDPIDAQALLRRSLALYEELGDRRGLAEVLRRLGVAALETGAYAEALTLLERALVIHQELGDTGEVAADLVELGRIHRLLGNHERAGTYLERAHALESVRGSGDLRRRARVAEELGRLEEARGDLPLAMTLQEQAVTLYRSARPPDVHGELRALHRVAALMALAGHPEQAREVWEQALERARQLGASRDAAIATLNLGRLHRTAGRTEEATALLERAVREFERRGALPEVAQALQALAGAQADAGETERALETARRALQTLEGMLGGLGGAEGSHARASFTEVFSIGVRAALRGGDLAEATALLESGRGLGLLEGLAGRDALRQAVVPVALTLEEEEARAGVEAARTRLVIARARAKLKEIRSARGAMETAQARVLEVVGRVLRETKRQAGIASPRASTLEEIQGALEAHEALVLYDLSGRQAVALVVRAGGATAVSLGPTDAIDDMVATLSTWDVTDATEQMAARLRKLVSEPLRLGEDVRRVLISPDGLLYRVPFALLLPDRALTLVPSGTALVMLRTRYAEAHGSRVLALGDPAYGDQAWQAVHQGRRLMRLPGTRKEAEAVGDVVLLGANATEEALLRALGEEGRWRAVHLACHGGMNPDRPLLSALVLAPTEKADGFLTALDILRLRIDADLVVLSVGQGLRGQVVPGEGLIGLQRAFLRAGAPRVLGTIGHADDEATAELMIRFYALYNPRGDKTMALGAAEALQQAQQWMRSQERWRHPRFWASWVLWGLP